MGRHVGANRGLDQAASAKPLLHDSQRRAMDAEALVVIYPSQLSKLTISGQHAPEHPCIAEIRDAHQDSPAR